MDMVWSNLLVEECGLLFWQFHFRLVAQRTDSIGDNLRIASTIPSGVIGLQNWDSKWPNGSCK